MLFSNFKSSIKWYEIVYDETTKNIANNLLNNPTMLTGKINTPYAIMFRDDIGTSIYGGGRTCIYVYTYYSDLYGSQFSLHANRIAFRYKNNGTWSETTILHE